MREFSLNVSILLGVRVPKINYPQKEKAKMQKISRVILIVCLFLSASIAQQQSYGLGFEFHTFPSAFMEEGGGSLGIYVPIETGSLLIEPLIMYSSSSTKTDYNDYSIDDSEYTESDFTLLIGILKPTERGKIRSYYGIRCGKQWTEKDYDDNDYDVKNENLIIAPTVGAEYFISDNFSFGGEAMYTMITREEEEEDYTTTIKQSVLIPRFIVRLYF